VNILIPYDEDTEIEMKQYAGSISSDILDEYYCLIGISAMREEYAKYYRIQSRPFTISEAA